jgi:hypothetical protein
MKRKGAVSELQHDILSSQFKEYNKQQDQIAKGKQVQIKLAEHKEKTIADSALNLTKTIFERDKGLAQEFLDSVRLPGETMGDELEPEFSYGQLGFKRTKPAEKKVAATSGAGKSTEKPAYTRKDVIAEARNMWKDENNPDKSVDDYMEQAETRLSGKKKDRTRNYKAGDKRNIKGVIYIRNENGEWIPQS